MLNRAQLKWEAKAITKNARVSAYLFTLLYLGIGMVLDGINMFASGDMQESLNFYFQELAPQMDAYFFMPSLHLPPLAATFVNIITMLVSCILGAGYILYAMSVRKGLETPCTVLFDGFTFAGKVILLNIVIYIFTFLWSLLFIVPGIIAAYRYRFALYNLCENPEMGVMEALNMSKAQTAGFKWQLFVLDLSFIGWSILCVLTLGILSIWITPYITQTDIGFFQQIKSIKGIGWQPPRQPWDDQFHYDDRFGGPYGGGPQY